MGRRWQHTVSEDWLRVRKTVLTATDIKSLVPELKRLKKKPLKPGEISPAFAALWAEKCTLSEMDPESPSSAAARGHIMEPYAVISYNKQADDTFYHWDDAIIVSASGLGFSPDAMDIWQEKPDPLVFDTEINAEVTKIMEIKSYNAQHHMKCILKDKDELDELWQLAMAFHILPNLKEAKLVFFCPDAPISMYVLSYTRKDLERFQPYIDEALALYKETAEACEKIAEGNPFKSAFTEQQIWKEYVESNYDNLILK